MARSHERKVKYFIIHDDADQEYPCDASSFENLDELMEYCAENCIDGKVYSAKFEGTGKRRYVIE